MKILALSPLREAGERETVAYFTQQMICTRDTLLASFLCRGLQRRVPSKAARFGQSSLGSNTIEFDIFKTHFTLLRVRISKAV